MGFIGNWKNRLLGKDIGIDLGTANTLVHVRGEGVVLCEPSVVAIQKDSGKVLAVGEEAKRMIGRTPADIVAVQPLRHGVIADFEVTQKMIRYFLSKVHNRFSLWAPRVVIGVPSGITEVERRAVKEAAQQAGAHEVYLIEEPMAAAIGANLPVYEPRGNIIVDIGGGTTEIGVISLGGLVFSHTIRIAGNEMDEAIVQYVKRERNLYIGERTAEMIKIKIGSAAPLEKELELEVKGRDTFSGLPRRITLSSEEVREALKDTVNSIISAVKYVLEYVPPELSADIVDHGIVMAGGSALLKKLDHLLAQETKLPVILAEDPFHCVVLGTGKYLEELLHIKRDRRRGGLPWVALRDVISKK
jgi:rod shape-determining protein MreB